MKISIEIRLLSLILFLASISSCRTIPPNAKAVTPFDQSKYLGKWYEIARLDFKFEKGLIMTSAEYSLNENGTINLLIKDTTLKKI